MRPIHDIAERLALPDKYFDQLGPHGGKIKLDLLGDASFPRRGKLILVTATTPTPSGEGKTVTSIGLTMALERIGKRAIITSRQPSLGPIFGMKGGAAGGGASTLEPSTKINLHFHGDFYAIAAAHNLLAALIDAHVFHGNELDIDPERITWPRTLDMNDRALRRIVLDGGRKTGFVITAASEIMAIVALATGKEDLRRRLESIVVGATRAGKPVRASDLHASGAMMALLLEAIEPNLVQTSEGTPALVHAGPFGNIAHGTSSVISQNMGLRLADYVVNECGFAADLGAEKYIDIVSRGTGVSPSVAVLVTTVQSVRSKGLPNLVQHLKILQSFGLPVVVAINRFPKDTAADIEWLTAACDEHGAKHATHTAFANGGAGAEELARRVVETIEQNPDVHAKYVYELDAPLEAKIHDIATRVYGASGVELTDVAKQNLRTFTEWGFGKLPICVAKTQYSISDDPKLEGAPTGWRLRVADATLSAGAGFVVVICGNMLLMPGLPKAPRAADVDVDASGKIVGV